MKTPATLSLVVAAGSVGDFEVVNLTKRERAMVRRRVAAAVAPLFRDLGDRLTAWSRENEIDVVRGLVAEAVDELAGALDTVADDLEGEVPPIEALRDLGVALGGFSKELLSMARNAGAPAAGENS